ncbi:MAG: cell division protein ZapA [Polyangiaceae bacterium]
MKLAPNEAQSASLAQTFEQALPAIAQPASPLKTASPRQPPVAHSSSELQTVPAPLFALVEQAADASSPTARTRPPIRLTNIVEGYPHRVRKTMLFDGRPEPELLLSSAYMDRRTVELHVAGQSYKVVSSAPEEELTRLAAALDARVAEIAPRGRPSAQGVLLAALAMAHDLEEERERRGALERRTRDLLRRVLMRIDDALEPGDAEA